MNRIRHHLIRTHVSVQTAFIGLDRAVQRRRHAARENGAISTELVIAIVTLMAAAVIVAVAYKASVSNKVKQFDQ